MALTPGSRLGPYEILSAIGAGGMGEVYRARDTKLNRDVAIKVLPPAFAQDAERLARFQREAQTLAALNHPNIAHIYGMEGAALVMELVEGVTLSGPLPVDEAVAIARQIADALEYAHEKGIVHRDLKPANIKITPEGQVKVLDFGLAKAMAADPESQNYANSPTLSLAATKMGTILGTAGYMSPEQAKGAAVDRRSDIWAFGVILYEMLTGKRLFPGESTVEILAGVLNKEPDISAAPARMHKLLRWCLEKDRKERLQAIGDARRLLVEDIASASVASAAPRNQPLLWILALIASASLAFALWNRSTAVPKTAVRLTIPLPPGQQITTCPAITRDGGTVGYVTQQGTDDTQLYLRDLNSFEARAVAGSSGARQPFFSPDGKWIAFFARGQLQKAEVKGGAPIRLAEASIPFGGTWNEDNTILFVGSLDSGLLRISASGGSPESLTKPDGGAKGYAHVFPQALPGGRSVYFTIWGQTQGGVVLSLDSGRWEMVLPQTTWAAGLFAATRGSTGRLLVVDQAAGLRAAPFDAAHPARTSADASVLASVYFDVETEARGWLSVSNTSTAVYASGNPARSSTVWVNREGKIEGKDQDVYREVSLSPDGAKAAVRRDREIWIHDLQRGTHSPLTPPNTSNFLPLWSRDGTKIIFASNRGGDWDIYSQPADGSRPADMVLKRPYTQFPMSVLADGTLLYAELLPKTGNNLWTLSPDGKTSPLRVTPFNEMDGQFSPGPEGARRWVAYSSDESGRNEIYVQSHPSGANRIPVSTGGGILPRWSRDGKELFYVTGDAVVAVPFRADGSVGAPRKLFDRSNSLFNPPFQTYDVSPDGKRFLMIQRDPGSAPRQLNVILNWSDELDQPAAGKK